MCGRIAIRYGTVLLAGALFGPLACKTKSIPELPVPDATIWLLNKASTGAPLEPIRPLTGVNAGPRTKDGSSVYAAQYLDMGVEMVRTHDFYGKLDVSGIYRDFSASPKDCASYDFSASDTYFQSILDAGLIPYLRLGESDPTTTTGESRVRLPTTASETSNWLDAMVQIVAHYNSGWSCPPGVGFVNKVGYVEIWNEPNNTKYWPTGASASVEFAKIFVELVQRLHTAHSGLRVGGPGFSPVGSTGTDAEGGVPWVDSFISTVIAEFQKYPESDRHLAFLSWHLYSSDPAEYETAAKFYNDKIEVLKKGIPIQEIESHVSEWNVRLDLTEGKMRITGEGVAKLTAAWIAMQSKGVDRAFFYKGIDNNAPSEAEPWGQSGLLFNDGTEKQITEGFRLWRQFVDFNYEHLTLVKWGGENLWAIAATKSDGSVGLLLANLNDRDLTWELTLPSAAAAPASAMKITEIDEHGNLVATFTPESVPVTIHSWTTQLVVVEP